MDNKWQPWVPHDLVGWVERTEVEGSQFPPRVYEMIRRLANDRRMRGFWEWLPGGRKGAMPPILSPLSICMDAERACRLPGKPGNMTPGQRTAYFEKVRKHVLGLLDLLEGTRFSRESMRLLNNDALNETLNKRLHDWGEDETGHIVAFYVDADGDRYEMSYDYPDCSLATTLFEVLEWTYWEDQWDGNPLKSSDPIVQANSNSTPIIYFVCTMFEKFKRSRVSIPFPFLATIANVALEIPAGKDIDEETVRKQVRRYEKRIRAKEEGREPADWGSGQNWDELADSVLSDPF